MNNDHTSTQAKKRPVIFWFLITFMSLSILLLLLGQTTAIFNYDFAVRLGMQEHVADITAIGVQVNRAFAVGDTLVYIPLLLLSIIGLYRRKRWGLITSAAVMGISVYWATTSAFAFLFLANVAEYKFIPGMDYWVVILGYIVFGLWGIYTLLSHGDALISLD